MTKTVERGRQDAPAHPDRSPKEQGRHLRHVRRQQGLSRTEVARSAGLTRRELAAYERGRVDIPESDLWCLAGSCGVDVGELLPHRDKLRVDSDLSSLAIGDTIRHLRAPSEPDGLLREYLSMIYELRNLPPGSQIPLRAEDLSALADALGGSPDLIESRLQELIGANREEAARLRAMILPPLSLPAPSVEQPHRSPQPQPRTQADFFAAPRAADPFAPPPPLEQVDPLRGTPVLDPVVEPATDVPTDAPKPHDDPLASLPIDPFALSPDASLADVPDPLARLRPDPFAPPGEPLGHDGIVVDLGEPSPYLPERDTTEPLIAPHRMLDVDVDVDVDAARPPVEDVAPVDVHDLVEPVLEAPVEETPPEPIAPIAWHAPVVALDAPTEPDAHPNGATASAPSFTRAGPDWQLGGLAPATAMADDGALALRRAEARWALCDVREPGDFTAEVVLDFTAGAGFGILFRASLDDHDRVSGYSFDVDTIAGGGGYQLCQWEANRPHWRPLAQAHVTDHDMLFGRHTITLTMRGDQLTVQVDGETIVTVGSLSRLSVEQGREPCRGDRLGIQAAATSELTVDHFATGAH